MILLNLVIYNPLFDAKHNDHLIIFLLDRPHTENTKFQDYLQETSKK